MNVCMDGAHQGEGGHAQIQQLGALLRSKAVTSVELVSIYLERLRRCGCQLVPGVRLQGGV